MSYRPTRDDAWNLLAEYVPSDNLRRHALAVEAVMRHMARKRGEDEEMWGIIGLVHDIDYERHPDEHCAHAPEICVPAAGPRSTSGRSLPTAGACAPTWSPSPTWRRPSTPLTS